MFQKLLKVLILTLCVSIVTADVTLEYSDEGVLRQDGNCDIMFTNFGGENTIIKQSVKKTFDKKTGTYNITLNNMINGNLGLNNDTQFDSAVDLPKYVKITQNDVEVSTFEITKVDDYNGKFNLLIYNMITCEGLKIKQTFKDELVSVANRLYYVNVVPESINQAFDSKLFGPSYSYPFERIHWKFNEGLEDLRSTCGIHMLYKSFSRDNAYHWQYYLSTDSVNTKNCTVGQFFDVLKRNYIDFHYTSDLLGENYMGYVFKREGHVEVHMDGIIAQNHYLIEVYQNKCNEQSEARTSCTIRSDEQLTFFEFTEQMIHNCMNETIDENEFIEWGINSKDKKNKKATGKLSNQIIEIIKGDKGDLPVNVDDKISYFSTSTLNATPIARFIVTISCGDGTFPNEVCQCQACAKHCGQCNNAITCLKCEDEETSYLDEYSVCIGKKGFFEDPVDSKLEKCNIECSECNSANACTVCRDPNAVMSDGECVCPDSFMKKDGYCFECEAGCSQCDEHGCLACVDESKVPDENGKCN